MKYTFFFIIAFLLLFLFVKAEANIYSSYTGRNFYVSFMQNEIELNRDPLILKIFLTSLHPTKYEVFMPGNYITGELRANDIKEIDVPEILEARQSEVPLQIAIQIKSEQPISVYCFSSKLTTSDSYSAIPVSRWGTKYIVASYPNDQYASPDRTNLDSLMKFTSRSSQFMIIAAYDGTVINFSPKARTRAGKLPTTNYQVTLNKGEVYLVQSFPTAMGLGDLTGTIVTGNKPFGLLSGHVRTAIPQTAPYPFDSKDHLVEMLPPTNTWGTNYISIPFGVNPKGDLFRIIAREAETIVEMRKSDGSISYLPLNSPGGFIEVRNLNAPVVWSSNKPIQIVQYMQHTGEFGDSKEYDPSMLVLPPVEQYVNDILFLTPRNYRVEDQFKEHRVGIVFENSALPTLTLDGQKITDLWDITIQSIPHTNYSWTSIRLREGRHQLKSLTGKFSGILYAYGFHDSYAMSLGNSLIDPANPDTVPPTINVAENCGKLQGSIIDLHYKYDLGIDYAYVVPELTSNYSWQISEISDTSFFATFYAEPIDIHRDGQFTIDVFDKASNRSRYTFRYFGTNINNISILNFPNTALKGRECLSFDITNNSNKKITLNNIEIENDSRVSWRTNQQLPIELAPNEKTNVQVCFSPSGDSTELNSNLILKFDCDYSKFVQLKGRVFAPQLELRGYDFGRVRLGKQSSGYIELENTGNTNVTIDKITGFDDFTDFKLENISYPITLLPREKHMFSVIFSPQGRYYYDFSISAINNHGLKANAQITGEGVAPKINSLKIDFGEKRVGTDNTMRAFFQNDGNDPTILSLLSLSGNLDDGNISIIQSLDKLAVSTGQKIPLSFKFNPQTPEIFSTFAELSCDWELHDPITIELIGRGTLPTIQTYNYRFDTTYVNQGKTDNVLIFSTGGNEDLTIHNIRIIGGDENSFIIDQKILQNSKLRPNENIFANITFLPHYAGEHTLYLEITSDALPAYQIKRDTVIISGFALPNDTLDYLMQIYTDNIIACNFSNGKLLIKNNGNINLNIQSISLTQSSTNFTINFANDIKTLLPYTILPDSLLEIPLLIYLERNSGGTAKFEVLFNDSLSETIQLNIFPAVATISILDANNLQVIPGDTVKLKIHGLFPHKLDTKIAPTISLYVNRFMLDILSQSTKLVLKNSISELEIIAQVIKNKDKIDLILGVDSLIITEPTEFFFTLEFIGLLHTDDSTTIKMAIAADNCYNPITENIPLKIINVCNFPLRPIKLITNLPYLSITPNPIFGDLTIELYLVEDDEISLFLTDMQGRYLSLDVGKKLTKGKHILKYNTTDLSDGVYNLICMSKQLKENIIFIKTK